MKIKENLDLDLEEYKLDGADRAKLISTISTDGFPVVLKVLRYETKKFILKLLNTPTTDDKAVLVNHMAAKIAGQIFEGFVHIINEAIVDFEYAPKMSDKPIDATEGVLDIGEYLKPDVNYFEER